MRVLLVVLLAAMACGDDDGGVGSDAGMLDSAVADSGTDSGDDEDSGTDAGANDAGTDAMMDPDAGEEDAAMGTVPVACAPPQDVDAPIGLIFLCEIELPTCRFFGLNGEDLTSMRNRCGDDGDTVDLVFDHNLREVNDPFVRTAGGWTIVATSTGSIQTSPGGDTSLVGLMNDTETTVTIEDESGTQYDVTFSFVADPRQLSVVSITAL